MLRVHVDNIEPGMVLARPILQPQAPRRFLLQRDQVVPMELLPRLRQLGVQEVWVRFRPLEFLEDLIDEEFCERQRDVYSHVRENFEQIMTHASAELDFSRFQMSIAELFHYLKQNVCGNVLLQKLDTFDNYLLSHSTNVCYLALLLGLRLEGYLIEERRLKHAREAKDIQHLGMGCLLHDVGKMRIPPEILHKPGKLSDEEMKEMRRHPQYGYDMVKGRVPPAAAEVVLNHHQRWNGTGYPRRVDARTGAELPPLAGRQIPVFSRIATIVDIYDAATSRRCYSEAKPPIQVLHEMGTQCRGFFDPVIEAAFYEIIPPFPIGQIVTLSDGVEAAVIDFNPRYPTRPKVQCIKDSRGGSIPDPSLEEIDLAYHDRVHIASVNGHDVEPYLDAYSRRPARRQLT